MRKKIINSAVFFTILFWLVVYLVHRSTSFLTGAQAGTWLALGAGSVLLILLAKVLLPVFEAVLVVTAKLGSVLFALITALVFFVLLTPLSLVMRLAGKRFVQTRYDPQAKTYYIPWQGGEDMGKQF